MAFSRSPPLLLLAAFFVLSISFVSGASSWLHSTPFPGGRAEDGFVISRSFVEDSSSVELSNSSFILAADRTYRRDPWNGLKYYTGGWNISNTHYWISVGFTAVPLFIIALIWLLVFGLVLLLLCCCYCCCRRRGYSYSRTVYAFSLVLLILFTCASIFGCILLFTGQGKFHASTSTALDYVVGQANITVDNLRNFSLYLDEAKKIGVNQISLPADVRGKIDDIKNKLNSVANLLADTTHGNSKNIQRVLDKVGLSLIIIAAVMLLVAFLGFLFSIFGWRFLVFILVIVGWILVAGTVILCGVFLLLHNVVGDTCVAMDEWIDHPHSHTALDDILPCVDVTTANELLNQSREVTYNLVNVVNQVIDTVANKDIPPGVPYAYYNQSGPLMPSLCNPFTADLSNHTCTSGEVSFDKASEAWRAYICQTSVVSGSEICTTVGRVTPSIYNQMTAAVRLSQGLYLYGPILADQGDCNFVRHAFAKITGDYCPGLGKYSKWIYVGLAIASVGVMLSLIFWLIFARERRHRKYKKQFMQGTMQSC